MEEIKFRLEQLPFRYGFLDPAGGKARGGLRRVSARSAIVIVAPSPQGHLVVLEAWAAKCPTSELVAKVFSLQETWKIKIFGVEANAMQSLFVDSLEMLAANREIKIPLTPVFQPTRVEKTFRIRTALQPVIESGRLILGETQLELYSELEAFPQGQTVDLVDALASAVSLVPALPPGEEDFYEDRGLERYLRSINTPEWYISKRLEQIREERTQSRQF